MVFETSRALSRGLEVPDTESAYQPFAVVEASHAPRERLREAFSFSAKRPFGCLRQKGECPLFLPAASDECQALRVPETRHGTFRTASPEVACLGDRPRERSGRSGIEGDGSVSPSTVSSGREARSPQRRSSIGPLPSVAPLTWWSLVKKPDSTIRLGNLAAQASPQSALLECAVLRKFVRRSPLSNPATHRPLCDP